MIRRAIATLLALATIACGLDADARPKHRRERFRPQMSGVDLVNNYAINCDGTDDFVHITPHPTGLDHTSRFLAFLRIRPDVEASGDVWMGRDNDSTQRKWFVDFNTITNSHGGLRGVQCQALNACGQTRLTNVGAVPLTDRGGYSVAVYLDHALQVMVVYVDGAASNITNAGTIATTDIGAATSRLTVCAKDNATGAFEADGRVDDMIYLVDPLMASGSAPTLLEMSQCIFDLNNDRGSRSWPSTCPSLTQTLNKTWCAGGDDDNGSGTTCTNRFRLLGFTSPGGNYDWTLAGGANFVANTEFYKIPVAPTVVLNNSLEQTGACWPAQSNCVSTANVLADLDSPTPGQADNYPNQGRIKVYYNDDTRWLGNTLPQPVDTQSAQVWGFAQVNNGGSWTDETADFNSAANADVRPFGLAGTSGDYIAFALPVQGTSARFHYIRFDRANGLACTGCTCAYEYCSAVDGSNACTTWSAASGVSDATTCFTAAVADGQVLSFTHPTNWVADSLNGNLAFHFRMRDTGTISVLPTLDQGFSAAQSNFYPNGADSQARVSPLVPFCDQILATHINKHCGIVPTAKGGAEIAGTTASTNWMPQHGQTTRLWGEAATHIAAIDSDAEVGWIMVWQGEGEINATLPAGGGTYPANWHTANHRFRMHAALEGIRDVLNNRALPICIVVPHPTAPTGYDATRWEEMRQGLILMASLMSDVVVYQMPDGYGISGDMVHESSAGVDLAGRACADLIRTTRRWSQVSL